jgi:hypothetical protein
VTAEVEKGSLLQVSTEDVAAGLATYVPLVSGNLLFRASERWSRTFLKDD